MADRFDVAGRLAEGLPAVEHTESYVRACQQIGYQHRDLTGDPAQIRDCYRSEDGLDLHALDADCEQLRAAGTVVMEALRLQRDQVGALAAAWKGPGADAAVVFLQHHCDVANALVAEVHEAAQRCESLRDNLWHLVDAKVATTIAIDDRTLVRRPAWLVAAAGVTAGTGDRAARELVNLQVKPYVDNDIRNEWLAAMTSTRAGVAESYDAVSERLATAPRACFEIPGDLGPLRPAPRAMVLSAAQTGPAVARPTTWGPASDLLAGPVPAGLRPAAGSVPAAAAAPGSWGSQTPTATLTPAAPPAQAAPMTSTVPSAPLAPPDWGSTFGDAAGISGGAGDLGGGGGLGGLGGHLGGLASRIVHAMGELLGLAGDPFTDASALGDSPGEENPFDEDADHRHSPLDREPAAQTGKREFVGQAGDVAMAMPPPGDPAAPSPQSVPVTGLPATGSSAGGAPATGWAAGVPTVTGAPIAGSPTAAPATAPVNGLPSAPPVAGPTPCQIAANELPQAGR